MIQDVHRTPQNEPECETEPERETEDAQGLTFTWDDRHWRVRGLDKQLSCERMKVNLMVTRRELVHVGGTKGSGLICAKHPPGRSGK